MRLPGRPIIRKGGAVVAFVGGGLQPYRRPGTQQKTRPLLRAGLTHHMHQVRLGSLSAAIPAAVGCGAPGQHYCHALRRHEGCPGRRLD